MKQKLLKALSLAAIALCTVSTAWADRVAPTMPESQSPVDGGCYWLYNVDIEQFLDGTNNTCNLADTGTDLFLTQNGDYWTIRKNLSNGYLLYSTDSYTYFTGTSVFNATKWRITANGSFLRLCTQYNESATPPVYLGYLTEENSNHRLYHCQTENIDWLLWDVTEAAHYAAEKSLYDALVATDGHGWIRDQYEETYENRSTATTLELNQAAEELNHALTLSSVSGVFDLKNDYTNIYITGESDWEVNNNSIRISGWYRGAVSKSLNATFEITENADLSYCVDLYNENQKVTIYIDGEKWRSIDYWNQYSKPSTRRWFEGLLPGRHTVKWTFEDTSEDYRPVSLSFKNIGVINTPQITVNCPLPGSLGTEILYNVDGVKDVCNLKVIGSLNQNDMTRLAMLTNAHYIDLSEATCTAYVPKEAFSASQLPYLHNFVMAEGITSIDEKAFYESNIETLSLPSTLKKTGNYAFEKSNLKSIYIPNSVTTAGTHTFMDCHQLEEVHFSEGMTTIPTYTFYNCYHLSACNIPEGVTKIENSAFYGCHSGEFCPLLPKSLKEIEQWAFYTCNGIETLVVPDNVNRIGQYAFGNCFSMKEITLPMNLYRLTDYTILIGCNRLKKITLNSPTLVKNTSGSTQYSITNNEYRPNITLCVPDYLVVPYKLDSYWYNFGDIVGFPSENIKDYTLHTDLLLDSHSRIAGDPNLTIENGALRIEGDAAMGITNFQTTTAFSSSSHNNNFSSLSQVRSGCENITIKGDYTHWMKLYGSRWAFVSLPFDCKVSDITDLTEGRLHAVRYYDGAERAATGTGSSWKKFAADAIIPAGQGFIIQVDGEGYNKGEYGWIQFKSQDNASKQYVFSKKEFSKHLDKNSSPVESNQGWNLVGNPYQCYYNIHNLNFTAPITVWDGYDRTYKAYSIIDDDYALRPNEAFFVQSPSALDAITFPVGGKQFDATILTQNASQHRAAATSSRKMLNLTLSNDGATDQTRIVINDEASLGYENACDASKFMSMDNTVAQLYTLDAQGTQYAINERPYDDGFVQLGASFATDGTYTIALARNDMGSAFLTDCETGETTDLTLGEYTFHANAGIDNGRFLLSFVGEGNLTAIEALTGNSAAEYYTIDGRHMGNNRSALGKGVYVVRSGNRSAKILVD